MTGDVLAQLLQYHFLILTVRIALSQAVRFLQMLALAGNCIYGTIPEEIGQLDHLLALELHENGLVSVSLRIDV